MWRVKFTAYSGMSTISEIYDDEQEARERIVEIIKRRRKRYAVTTITNGEEWEVLEPEDCSLIPDACGSLRLIHLTYDCRECGQRHETNAEAAYCCSESCESWAGAY